MADEALEEVVEAMARGLCVADGFDPDGLIAYAKAGQKTAVEEWAAYLRRARSVLTHAEALGFKLVAREPTTAMRVAPSRRTRWDDLRPADVFYLMWDAAPSARETEGGAR